MSLGPGTRLGVYEVTGKIGKGRKSMPGRYVRFIAVTVAITACSVPIYVQQELTAEEFAYVRVRGEERDAASQYSLGTNPRPAVWRKASTRP